MNPTIEAPPLPPLPPQPHHHSTSCHRHPEEHFTGFCPSCLCERLAVLDHSSSASSSSSSRKPPTTSTAAAALKAIFKPPTGAGAPSASKPNRPSSFFPELRRTKSFSASKNEGFSGVFEPQRKSCDVRVRNTLWSLFNQDDGKKGGGAAAAGGGGSGAVGGGEIEVESRNLGGSSSSVQGPVFESKEEEEEEEEEESEEEDQIRVFEETNVANVNEDSNRVQEIVEEEEEEEEEEEGVVLEKEDEVEDEYEREEELKPMKDHIDLDSQTKKRDLKEIAGSFWSAASVFSKKLQKWRQKQKLNKKRRNGGGGSATLPVEKPIGRQFRETQSEIADYGFGRRSCDTDPRFSLDAGRMSLDAGRMSFDDPRYSFDEPRASWDGYLIGRTFPSRMPTMLSVVEDAPVVHVMRSDTQIPVEEPPPPMNSIHEDEKVPGGSAQTRDYYSDSSSRRRKSLDRSSSIRKTAAAVVAEIDEMKSAAAAISNAKVSPATTASAESCPGPKLVVTDRDSRDSYSYSNSNSLRDDCSEATFDMGFGKGSTKKLSSSSSRRWSKAWNIWGLIHRRGGGGNKDEDEDRYSSRANGVERSFSESWPERNGDPRVGFNPKMLRSNSSVSWRNSNGFNGGGGSFGSMRKNSSTNSNSNNSSSMETNGNGRKKKDEFVLERNRSARYSPNHADNGLLRFYLTPLRSSRRSGGTGGGKSRYNQAHSIARSVLRLY